ncbi:ATP-grasp fold amidoligase family protein [Vibrio vulnificus]|uniref:ATP-grasp fold amidoligase family protein n=1 Tax=Vibrio vulnificus TaxID=672 RepID=UPI002FBDB2BB
MFDIIFSTFAYVCRRREIPNILNPKTLSEKILYKKLFPTKFECNLRKLVSDRLAVREYVNKKGTTCILIPIHWSGETITKDVWESLPSKFVIKANHGSKMVKIVDKAEAEFSEIFELTELWKKTDYYKKGREWVYKDLPRTLLVEEYMTDLSGDVPPDYKFFCLNGKVEFVQLDLSRFKEHKRNLYDRKFNKLDVKLHFDNGDSVLRPSNYDEAVRVAEKLAEDFDFIRVDLYLLESGVHFGELTNFPGNCFEKFSPSSFDSVLGEKLYVYK